MLAEVSDFMNAACFMDFPQNREGGDGQASRPD